MNSNKLILNNIQKAIFQRLTQNKVYDEIAKELHLTIDDVEFKVKSVFCLIGFQNVNKEIVEMEILGERLN